MEPLALPPVAGPFVESLRSIGYSLESAVADVIDNSISANAKVIEVDTRWASGNPYLMISDNGHGMDESGLQSAMQLGSIGPSTRRNKTDLGRFGMGLKTASFSQCKKLTVISRMKTNTPWKGICWDLDFVEKKNEWLAQKLSEGEVKRKLEALNFSFEQGTAVIWNRFDKIIDLTAPHAEKDYERSIRSLKEHLALTYHRFLKGENSHGKISLRVNGREVDAKDPFALYPPDKCSSSTLLTNEIIRLGEKNILVKAYQIPHPSQMPHDFQQRVSPGGNHHLGQGIYIYRAGRLISAGGWMRLAKASEANKLARIHVEFENDADDIWKIDVKKSRVELPSSLREQLRRVVSACSLKSSRTFTRRAKMKSTDKSPVWDRYFDRERERVLYKLNTKHPALSTVFAEMPERYSKTLINLLEQTLPLELIKNDISATNIEVGQANSDLQKNVAELANQFHLSGFSKDIVRESILGDGNIAINAKTLEEILNNIWG
ncbi:ATP-binding protein [Biformimicrobium ophioploci]|uniref:ATP-binding protein n=1 Tax=Biformimicrobium ophioploci TaxID=3036711 RepID=A0ABQ6LVY2_9GAMM|nr:ATP-binding protein [Microbulbifer sp. NKW57]GMG86264.1 ATP-binding protein [Microbulbifer sp. NKW57]